MEKKRVIFMGSKMIGFNCLEYLLLNQLSFDVEIQAIFSKKLNQHNNSFDFRQLSEKYNIPLYRSVKELNKLDSADFIISVQHHEILKEQHLKKARQLAINLHMAPVPEYRGCNQFSFAIIDEAEEFGTTIHVMDTSIDGGAILFEKRFPIPEGCWVTELHELTVKYSFELFKENIADIFSGNYTPKPQSAFKNRKSGFHLRSEINEIKQIDLSWDKEKIERHVRACYFPPFEPPYCTINSEKVYLTPDFPDNDS